MKLLNIKRLRNTELPDTWGDFIYGPYDDSSRILAIQMIMLFSACEDGEIRKLGHRLALLYAKNTGDYSAIHAVASMAGLAPVVRISEQSTIHDHDAESFVELVRKSFSESLKEGDIYLTAGQKQLKGKFLDGIDEAISVVAPTSYGKSSLISDYVERTDGNFCVIVPTKSLLAQTRRMLLQGLSNKTLNHRKIITHHEMYNDTDKGIIAVLTQERLLRLMQINPTILFSHLIIDESHNLFENDSRSRGLASAIIITNHRNPELRIKFLSPFIADSNNLENRISRFDLIHLGTGEYVKSELIYHIDFRQKKESGLGAKWIYDQFMDRSYPVKDGAGKGVYDYILKNAGNKNIIYLNRPIKTHEVARGIAERLPELDDEDIAKACRDIGAYLNKDYLLVFCIKRGVIFHHGSVPDNVRLYLEHLYSTSSKIRFVITTSTLLEGVNLPAEKMFLLDIKKGNRNLSSSQLKNLIGRVSRFKEVFLTSNINGLLPEIHFVGSEYFPTVTTNIEAFLRANLREGKESKDKVENPLLENADISEPKAQEGLKEELGFLGNAEPGVLDGSELVYEKPKTKIGKLCYLNRIADFNVLHVEKEMDGRVMTLKRLGVAARNSKELIEMINEVFLKNLPEEYILEDTDIARLRDSFKARDFYSMILEWRTSGYTYQRMIAHFIAYWKKIEGDPSRCVVYAGSWGNRNRVLNINSNFNKYIDISSLGHAERVTLSIARIEAEMAFLDYNVMKYIDCLLDLELIDPAYMNLLRFGTDDDKLQKLMQAGMSHSLAKIVNQDDFKEHLIYFPCGAIGLSPDVSSIMTEQGVNTILVNEARYYTRN